MYYTYAPNDFDASIGEDVLPSPFIIQKVPVRLLRRALVHAQIEVTGRDQPIVAQDLLDVPDGAPVEEERRCHRVPQHVRGHGLREADRGAKPTKPGKRDLLFKPLALSTYDKKGFAAVLPPQ